VETLKKLRQNDRAEELCVSLEFGGYKDWFLPSIDELDMMYKNLKLQGLGGFGDEWYWSSSEAPANGDQDVWAQRFSDGRQVYNFGNVGKNVTRSVRAVRAF
jgi:hypothetical protein